MKFSKRYAGWALRMALVFLAWTLAVPNGLAQASGPPSGNDFLLFKDQPEAHDFAMVSPDGSPIRLSDLKGSVVILSFWRQNCHYCVMEKKQLTEMVQSLGRPDLKVLCVNLWDNPAQVRAYGRKNGRELMVAARPDGNRSVMENVVRGRLMGYYVLNEAGEAIYEVKGFPSSYVIDKEGRVVAGHMGFARWAAAPVQHWISSLVETKIRNDNLPQDEYELPLWIDRLLSASPNGMSPLDLADERRAQVGPIE